MLTSQRIANRVFLAAACLVLAAAVCVFRIVERADDPGPAGPGRMPVLQDQGPRDDPGRRSPVRVESVEALREEVVTDPAAPAHEGVQIFGTVAWLGQSNKGEVGTYSFWIDEDGVGATQVRLPPGRYTVRALASINRVYETDVQVIAGQTTKVHLDY